MGFCRQWYGPGLQQSPLHSTHLPVSSSLQEKLCRELQRFPWGGLLHHSAALKRLAVGLQPAA